jgi:O-Antigen ligase
MINRQVSIAAALADFDTPARSVSEKSQHAPGSTAYVGVCALAIIAPFELLRPLVRLPWQSVSNVEGVLAIVFCAWLWSIVSSGTWPRWQTPLTPPWMALLAAMTVSALMAPTGRVNALHMAGRLTIGFAVFLLTVNAISTPERLRRAMAAAVVAGLIVGVLAILEYLQVSAVLLGLRAFRPALATVGGQVRAGGTLQYPTIASMYLEIVFAFGLGLLSRSVSEKSEHAPSRPASPAENANNLKEILPLFLALVVIAEAITLTSTRAGLLTMTASLGLVGTVRYSRHGFDTGVQLVAVLAFLIPIMVIASRSAQSVWLRLTSQGQDTWYRFAVDAPAELTLTTGDPERVPVRATNEGRLTWDSSANPPVYLSYHWLLPDGSRVVAFDGVRTSFPAPVPPGATVSVQAQVRAPRQPGRYRLEWDLVEEDRLWFSTEPGAGTAAFSDAMVIGPATGDRSMVTYPLPVRAVRPARLFLWRAAARMIVAHPVLGVGPDNFRLLYGEYSGLPYADPRLHSNNMYIEILAGGGLTGGFMFLWLMWRTAERLVAAIRLGVHPRAAWAAGVAAAGIAVLLHGTVDSFLSFTPTYILISMTLGFAVAGTCGPVRAAEGQAGTDADRF